MRIIRVNSVFTATLLGLGATAMANAQPNTFPATGSVGIGTDAPTTKLEVRDGTCGVLNFILKLNSMCATPSTGEFVATGLGPMFGARRAPLGQQFTGFDVRGSASGQPQLFVVTGTLGAGRIGIGTDSPGAGLDIVTPFNDVPIIRATGNTAHPTIIATGGASQILVDATTNPITGYGFKKTLQLDQESAVVFPSSSRTYYLGTDNESGGNLFFLKNDSPQTVMVMTGAGNVGIGCPAASSKLEVNGTIRTKEVIVSTDDWCDHVFQESHALMPLDELAAYIERERHLPGIPTKQEVMAQGVAVGQLQTRLLEKVEEMTLYILALKEENDALKQKVQRLEDAGR